MSLEQDYIMKMIKSMIKALAALILGKNNVMYELPKENHYTALDELYVKLIQMADKGQINEAENLLYEELDDTDNKSLEVALGFYSHLSEFDHDFLESNDYSKEEIIFGIKQLAKRTGYEGVLDIFGENE